MGTCGSNLTKKQDSKQTIELLKRDYDISILPVDFIDLTSAGYQMLPADSLAYISGALQHIPGLALEQVLADTYQRTYAGAYRVVIPEGSENLTFIKNTRLTAEFGEGAKDLTLVDSKGVIRRHAGVQKIDPPNVKAQQIAYAAFSVASVVTSQYFLYRIDKKLQAIQKTTADILQFLELDKRAKLQARCERLEQIKDNLPFALKDDSERSTLENNLFRIREEATTDVIFYRERIRKTIEAREERTKKAKINIESNKNLDDMVSNLSGYWTALYAQSLAVVLSLVVSTRKEHIRLEQERQRLLVEYETYSDYYRQCVKAIRYPMVLRYVFEAMFGLSVPTQKDEDQIFDQLVDKVISKANEVLDKKGKARLEQIQGWDPEPLGKVADSITVLDQTVHRPLELVFSDGQVYMKIQKEDSLEQDTTNWKEG